MFLWISGISQVDKRLLSIRRLRKVINGHSVELLRLLRVQEQKKLSSWLSKSQKSLCFEKNLNFRAKIFLTIIGKAKIQIFPNSVIGLDFLFFGFAIFEIFGAKIQTFRVYKKFEISRQKFQKSIAKKSLILARKFKLIADLGIIWIFALKNSQMRFKFFGAKIQSLLKVFDLAEIE